MHRPLLILCFAAMDLHAAVIHGIVLEQRSGYSLSGATVTLDPVSPMARRPPPGRTGENGQFTFDGLPAGDYLLKATRRGFLPIQYGQRRWDAAGTVITLDANSAVSVTLPMLRYGGITGTVRDSSEVGIPDQEVAAYTNTQPPRLVARAKSDDRGIYRIGGLSPGNYLVRTTGNKDEERSYLPTFSRQTLRVEEAAATTVYADEDTPGNDVRPIPGNLFSLSGSVAIPNGFTVTVTLASDLGRRVTGSAAFNFTDLAPGHYELYADAREEGPGDRIFGGYTDLYVGRNMTRFTLPMTQLRDTTLILTGGGRDALAIATVRRRDDAGAGPEETFTLGATTNLHLLPGHWDVRITPPSGVFVSGFATGQGNASQPWAWNDVFVSSQARVNVTLSGNTAAIHGIVRSSSAPAREVPVFLELWDPATRSRLDDLRETYTDPSGSYRFDGLPPGDYRLLSTLDYTAPATQIFDISSAAAIKLDQRTDTALDLEFWGNQ